MEPVHIAEILLVVALIAGAVNYRYMTKRRANRKASNAVAESGLRGLQRVGVWRPKS